VSPADLAALWDEARATLAAEPMSVSSIDAQLFRLAREGHRNARPIVDMLTPSTDCACGAEELCPGIVETPERVKRREVFTRLAKALEEA
jgi:hypothetical protein